MITWSRREYQIMAGVNLASAVAGIAAVCFVDTRVDLTMDRSTLEYAALLWVLSLAALVVACNLVGECHDLYGEDA